MGLFSSKSSSSTSNVYNTDNSNLGATDGGVVLRDSTLSLVDPGSVALSEKALDTVGAAISKVADTYQAGEETAFEFLGASLDKALDFAGDTVSRTYEQTTKSLEKSQAAADASLKQFVALADQSQKQGVQALTENVFRYGAWALVGLALAGGVYAYASRTRH